MSARPGLQEFAVEPERAGVLIRRLLEFAKRRVPRADWGETKVRLIENGGLGGLEKEVRKGHLGIVQSGANASEFSLKDDRASSITGQEKGIYAWVAANYTLGTLGANHKDIMGVVELGDASTQDGAWESLHKLWTSRLLAKTSNLIEEAVLSPCFPKGYNQTSVHDILLNFEDTKISNLKLQGNFEACRGDILALFQEQGLDL